jgi:RNase adapter protein RapZ
VVKKIVSFGFRHGNVPTASDIRVLDVRELFRNPWHNRALRKLKGLHPDVQAYIEQTPRFEEKLQMLEDIVADTSAPEVWIGCTGGHHRSVYMADRIGRELGIPVEHRDLNKP